MCNNVKIEASAAQIAAAFDLYDASLWGGPVTRLTISQDIPSIKQVDGKRSLELVRWGFIPFWMKDPKGGTKPVNARSETVATSPMFRDAFKTRRCIVPVTGFYEWIGEKGSKKLLPFTVAGRPLFGLAGIFDDWQRPDGTALRTCAVLTSTPSADIVEYHDRMPVILEHDDEALWLAPDATAHDLMPLLAPLPDGLLRAHPEDAYIPSRG